MIRVHVNKNENLRVILARGWENKQGDNKFLLNFESLEPGDNRYLDFEIKP